MRIRKSRSYIYSISETSVSSTKYIGNTVPSGPQFSVLTLFVAIVKEMRLPIKSETFANYSGIITVTEKQNKLQETV